MILVIQGWLPHYRLELFNALAAIENVAVVHSGEPARRDGDLFEEVVLPVKPLGPFMLQQGILDVIEARQPRAIIAMFDVRWVNTVRAMYRFDRRLKWVWWGLDRGRSDWATKVKLLFARRPNPIVFYNEVTRAAFSSDLGPRVPLFVANNTFHVPNRAECFRNPVKNRIINVGSLEARKENGVTIRVLKKICDDTGADIRFSLIGDGPDRATLTALVAELGMQDRVELVGRIDAPSELARYYAEAIASVSFGQAGLAVLQSMAFGVPFLTKENAVSGGEKHNISDGETGIIVKDDPVALEAALRRLFADPDAARRLGEAAYHYYSEAATVENMVANFVKAIDAAGPSHD